MNDFTISIGLFIAMVVTLVGIIIIARKFLVPSGNVTIEINGEKTIEVPVGGKLLSVLAENKIFIPSACGGGGSCGQCGLDVHSGGGDILATEEGHITKKEARRGKRLSCQVAVKNNMKIQVEDEVFGVKKWKCTVKSNDNVATFIKEFVVQLPAGEKYHSVRVAIYKLKPQYTMLNTKILILMNSITLIGITSVFLKLNQKLMNLLSAHTLWQTIQAKKASLFLMCVLLRHRLVK